MISILYSTILLSVINSYKIKIVPSISLDFAGKIMNTYQIMAHIGVCYKFLGYNTTIYGAQDDQELPEFFLMNVLDYAGWLAIFSRMNHIPMIPKIIANTHMATGMMNLLGHNAFQDLYIKNNLYYWNMFRAGFVLSDAIVRTYYHVWILNNY